MRHAWPIIKTGAEYPFTKQFYQYTPPREPEDVLAEVLKLDAEIDRDFEALKEGNDVRRHRTGACIALREMFKSTKWVMRRSL